MTNGHEQVFIKRPGCLGVIIGIILIIALSFRPEKQYAMKFTGGEIMQILLVIDQSKAPHDQVRLVQMLFDREIKPHLDSTGSLK